MLVLISLFRTSATTVRHRRPCHPPLLPPTTVTIYNMMEIMKMNETCVFSNQQKKDLSEHDPSFTWRSIWGSKSLLLEGLKWRVGVGRNINVWQDAWLPGDTSARVPRPKARADLSMVVADLIDPITGSWCDTTLAQVMEVDDIKLVHELPLSSQMPWILQNLDKEQQCSFLTLAWEAWTLRNMRTFDESPPGPAQLLHGLCSEGEVGLGVVGQDSNGSVIVVASKRIRAGWSVEIVEAMSARFGLTIADTLGLDRIMQEKHTITKKDKIDGSKKGASHDIFCSTAGNKLMR